MYLNDEFKSSLKPVPTHPPVNVLVWNLTSTSLHVEWSPVPLQHRSGLILGYRVTYWRSVDNSSLTNKTLTTENEEIEITGLEVLTPYMVVVAAFNQIGDGVMSDPQEAWTSEHCK